MHTADTPRHRRRRLTPLTPRRTATGARAGPRTSWAVLAVALAAQILVVLDISVVNTALPTIGESLRLGSSDLQWLVTAYLMMSGGGLLLGGRIADLLSRRRVFLTGLALFTVASLVSGFADNGSQLIAARAVQGLGAALLTPAALSLIMTTYAGAQRTTAAWPCGVPSAASASPPASCSAARSPPGPAGSHLLGQRPHRRRRPARRASRSSPRTSPPAPSLGQFDLPGAAHRHRRPRRPHLRPRPAPPRTAGCRPAPLVAFAASAVAAGRVRPLEQRAARPLVPPHTWKVTHPGVRHHRDARRHRHPGRHRLPDLDLPPDRARLLRPAGRARVPAVRARHHRRHPRRQQPAGQDVAAQHRRRRAARHRRRASCCPLVGPNAHFATDLLPGLLVLGLGVGMVFVAVSVTAMAGIPAQHAGVASGFLMTGHEIGAALGVAVLSAVATTAGSLTTPPESSTRSPPRSSPPPSSPPSSVSSPTCGCPRPG